MLDLHVHSHWSDGECSPYALVQDAVQKGLCAIALTDHDTLKGVEELEQAGKQLGLPVYGSVLKLAAFSPTAARCTCWAMPYRKAGGRPWKNFAVHIVSPVTAL